ncbi:MAG TPA: hypothetical protein VE954_05770 [Oligoflexus sp.]|uniref:hypothetical protein n=1 Tax=Oligoflexus sp. TaxID=1971216 RepID=UPI002D61FFF0|nr:hypothetical protein [Oligoflexus sp.]HYX32600.1 hypothetical protein [Oligoflexus sp.]
MITILDKALIACDGQPVPLLEMDGRIGLMQSQLAAMLDLPAFRLSYILCGNNLERHPVSRSNSKELKQRGIIHRQGTGNFLPIETVIEAINLTDSIVAKKAADQIMQYVKSKH